MRRLSGTVLRIVSLAVVLSPTTVATAQEIPQLTVDSAVELAIAADNEIASLEAALADQLYALGWGQYRDDITLRLSGSVEGNADGDLSGNGSSELSASVQLIPQLSVTGSLSARLTSADGQPGGSDPLSGTVGLQFRPLADAHGDERDELSVEQTRGDIARAVMKVSYSAISRLFSAVEAVESLSLSAAQHDLAVEQLAAIQARYDRERATEAELDNARNSVRSAERQTARNEIALRQAAENLSQVLGLEVTPEDLPGWEDLGLDELLDSVVAHRDEVSTEELALSDSAVVKASYQIASARIDLAAARRFTPNLTISVSAALPDLSYGGQAELSISPSQWDGSAVSDAEDDLEQAQQAYDYAYRTALLGAEMALLDFDYAVADVELAREDLGEAVDTLAETEFRFDRGTVTALAVTEAELAVTRAESSVNSAVAAALKQWHAVDLHQY
jgi:outer membrane protein TolC